MTARSVTGVPAKTETAAAPAALAAAPAREAPERRAARLGLSGRLFLVTVAFVVVAEVLTYVPAVANYRIEWMSDRLAAAQVAALVLDGRTGEPVSEALESRLLAGVNARAIAVRGGGAQRLLAHRADARAGRRHRRPARRHGAVGDPGRVAHPGRPRAGADPRGRRGRDRLRAGRDPPGRGAAAHRDDRLRAAAADLLADHRRGGGGPRLRGAAGADRAAGAAARHAASRPSRTTRRMPAGSSPRPAATTRSARPSGRWGGCSAASPTSSARSGGWPNWGWR